MLFINNDLMPGRYKKIYNQGIYHVFNKTINDFPVFNYQYNCELLIKTLRYYRSNKATLPLSRVNNLDEIDEGFSRAKSFLENKN